MLEMFKSKWIIALIILILGASYIGGIETKKTAESEPQNGQAIVDLNK